MIRGKRVNAEVLIEEDEEGRTGTPVDTKFIFEFHYNNGTLLAIFYCFCCSCNIFSHHVITNAICLLVFLVIWKEKLI